MVYYGILLALFEWQINLQSKNFKHLNVRRPVIVFYTRKVLIIGCYQHCKVYVYSYVDTQTGVMRIEKYKSSEAATVEQVLLLGGETGRLPLVCAAIKVCSFNLFPSNE